MLTTDSALCPSARQRHGQRQLAERTNAAHQTHRCPKGGAIVASTIRLPTRSMKRPTPKAPADPAGDGPEIQFRVVHPTDAEIGEQWFRDETEALGAARQRAHIAAAATASTIQP